MSAAPPLNSPIKSFQIIRPPPANDGERPCICVYKLEPMEGWIQRLFAQALNILAANVASTSKI